ncbi:MAG: vWA domain-containing protein [Bdellovibrio sp.]
MNKKILLTFFIVLLALSFQNCSKITVAPSDPGPSGKSLSGSGDYASSSSSSSSSPQSPNPKCQPGVITSNAIVKVLFVMDTSGSNAYASQGALASDIGKVWRLQTINNFFTQHQTNNFYYGLISFSNNVTYEIADSAGNGIFSNDLSVVQAGIQSFQNIKDDGATNYQNPLQVAKTMIENDMNANASQNALYVMVIVSDGMATDYASVSEMDPDVEAIVNLAPSKITLNSVYYYNTNGDPSQAGFLQEIAKLGSGSYLNADASQPININSSFTIPSGACQ